MQLDVMLNERRGGSMNHPHTEIKHYVSTDDFYQKVMGVMEQNAKDGIRFSIATIDIDHFNYVNDLFGFQTGDLILQKVKEHFGANLKENEFFTRLHADIFAFCIESTEHSEVMQQFSVLTNWNEMLKHIFPVHYSMKASGGFISLEDASLPVSAILDKANYARNYAKNSITSSFRFYDDKMSGELQWQKNVTFSMESALENGEFEMYLQPKAAIKSNQIVGAEALVRWNSPAYGLIAPDRFIPILEQNGFIRQLDFYMLGEACRFIKDSPKKGIPQLPISVNN